MDARPRAGRGRQTGRAEGTGGRAILTRIASAVMSLLGASILIWALMPLAPGNPARLILQARGIAEPTPEQINEVSQQLGLDRPLLEQYVGWLRRLFSGDLGISYGTGRPVTTELAARMGATTRLAVSALILALLVSLILGLISAYWPDRWPDRAGQAYAVLASSVPSFVVALILIQIFVIGMGMGKVSLDGRWSEIWLPAVCLAIGMSDMWSRLLRSSMLGYLVSTSAVTLEARGARRMRLLWHHALPNSSVVSLNALALGLASLFGGAAIVESVFTWPGIGAWVVEAVKTRDIPSIQAFTLIATAIYVTASLGADLLSRKIDPRIVIA